MCDTLTRFAGKILLAADDPDGCWPWIGAKAKTGYGRFRIGGTLETKAGDIVQAHRYSYEYFYGVKVPKEMPLDHICRNRPCVRPDHLRIVTARQNALENSASPLANNYAKSHCPAGHPYNDENTYLHHQATGIRRHCKACHKIRQQNVRGRLSHVL